jgi:hypothetical protein
MYLGGIQWHPLPLASFGSQMYSTLLSTDVSLVFPCHVIISFTLSPTSTARNTSNHQTKQKMDHTSRDDYRHETYKNANGMIPKSKNIMVPNTKEPLLFSASKLTYIYAGISKRCHEHL